MIQTTCNFERTETPQKHRCVACGRTVISQHPPERCYADCGTWNEKKPVLDCIHFGREVNRQRCEPCGGTRIKVFQCTIHGQCQIEPQLENIKDCKNCENREKIKA